MEINSGDTAWVLVSTAMVMLMTPGVGLFYGGLVRSKTVVSMIGLSFLAFAIASIQWVLFGYSLSFGSDISGIIGGLNYFALSGVGLGEAPLAGKSAPSHLCGLPVGLRSCDSRHPHLSRGRKGPSQLIHRAGSPLDHSGL